MRRQRYASLLGEFILTLHGRYLGCRLGYDEDGSLAIMADIYPDTASPKHVVAVIRQLDFVANTILPLIRNTLETGESPDSSVVDQAFAGQADD
jgi:hypothetical protein